MGYAKTRNTMKEKSIHMVRKNCYTVRSVALLVYYHRQYRCTQSCNKTVLGLPVTSLNVFLFLLAYSMNYSLQLQVPSLQHWRHRRDYFVLQPHYNFTRLTIRMFEILMGFATSQKRMPKCLTSAMLEILILH